MTPGSPTPQFSAAQIAQALGQSYAPTAEQQAVIEAPLEPQLVVAGAGSGKTETMAARVVYLVANHLVAPQEILGLTFTRKAAGELNERIAARLRTLAASGLWVPPQHDDLGDAPETSQPSGAAGLTADLLPTVSTYHSYAGSIVKDHGLRLGVEPDARLLSQAAAWQYAHQIVSGWDGDMEGVDARAPSVTASVIALAGELAEHLRTPADIRAYYEQLHTELDSIPFAPRARSLGDAGKALNTVSQRHRALLPLVERYQALKAEQTSLDFADQVAFAAALAQRFGQVGRDQRQRYRMVLLDEFQDTSEAQIAFLAALFASGSDRPGVTAVGDPHQSIFAWRGASASTLDKFARVFALPGQERTSQLSLSTSWRNDADILAAANITAAELTRTSAVQVKQLQARPGAGRGRVEIARVLTSQDEAALVADWVGAARREKPGVTAAVLCRKRAQFAPMLEAFAQRGIPAEAVGLGGLLQTPEVVDLVSLLWVVDDPSRGDKFMRLLTHGGLRLGAADIAGLHEWARELHDILRDEAQEYLAQQGLSASESEADPDAHDAETLGGVAPPPASSRGGVSPRQPRQVRDLAADSRDELSLVEAIEQLPDASWRGRDDASISETALTRLRAFNQSLAKLRKLAGLPLADFVSEAERVLGLDIEVLARPDYDMSSARAHLDAFADIASTFSAQADRPTLGGFLEWLEAAEREERGLELPTIEVNTDAVQVLTVHAAKGLEWDVVAVPGLNQGVFPSLSGRTKSADGEWTFDAHPVKGWVSGYDSIPYALRGDAADLPSLQIAGSEDSRELNERFSAFTDAGRDKALADERRLAYVAFTRAREAMLLSAPIWTPEALTPRLPSVFLTELRDAAQAGQVAATTIRWDDLPEPAEPAELTNPLSGDALVVEWPHDDMARAREQLGDGPKLVESRRGRPRPASAHVLPLPGTREDRDQEVELLLAERRRQREHTGQHITVPEHLSTSALVKLHENPQQFALDLRRPMPSEPAVATRRGTEFHAWVESHYREAALLDVDELPGYADETVESDVSLAQLQENFLASEWAEQKPIAVEVNVETVIAGFAIRGRVDAVFARPDGGFTIVDWKTGRPGSSEQMAHRVFQLGSYAVAYARLQGVPQEQVDGAFFFAGSGQTVRPQLPDSDEIARVLTDALGE